MHRLLIITSMLVAFLATSAQAAKHLTVQARPLSELVTATTGPVQPGAGNIDPTITWGGDAGLGPVADGARYNPTADTWSPMRDAPIARIMPISCVRSKNAIVMVLNMPIAETNSAAAPNMASVI